MPGFDIDRSGMRAIVTGASSGIGAEYARRLAERGWHLTLVARREKRLTELADELRARAGVDVRVVVADLGRREDVAMVADEATHGDVALLVNNAGINGYGPFAELDPALMDQLLAVNVVAPVALARAALPGLLARGHGAIVNVASLLAFSGAIPPGPLPCRATYAGTKSHLITFTRTLAEELVEAPVRVQVLCPGLTATAFNSISGLQPAPDHTQDRGEFPGMSAADVVTASLIALATGEVMCVPGLADTTSVTRLAAVEAEFRAASQPVLADRYRERAARM